MIYSKFQITSLAFLSTAQMHIRWFQLHCLHANPTKASVASTSKSRTNKELIINPSSAVIKDAEISLAADLAAGEEVDQTVQTRQLTTEAKDGVERAATMRCTPRSLARDDHNQGYNSKGTLATEKC